MSIFSAHRPSLRDGDVRAVGLGLGLGAGVKFRIMRMGLGFGARPPWGKNTGVVSVHFLNPRVFVVADASLKPAAIIYWYPFDIFLVLFWILFRILFYFEYCLWYCFDTLVDTLFFDGGRARVDEWIHRHSFDILSSTLVNTLFLFYTHMDTPVGYSSPRSP